MNYQDLDAQQRLRLDKAIPPADDGPLPGAMRRLVRDPSAPLGPPDAEGRVSVPLCAGDNHQWLAVRQHVFACGDVVIHARCSCGHIGWSLFCYPNSCGPRQHGPLSETGLGENDKLDSWHQGFLSVITLMGRYPLGRAWEAGTGQPFGN